MEGRSINKYDWPIILIYALIFLVLIAASILICICLCDKDAAKDELGDEERNKDEEEMMMPEEAETPMM